MDEDGGEAKRKIITKFVNNWLSNGIAVEHWAGAKEEAVEQRFM